MANNNEYFTLLHNEIYNGEYDKAFYDYFMSIDLENYNFTNNRPITNFYNNMKEINLPIIIKFIENIIDKNTNEEIIKFTASELFSFFNDFIKNNNFKIKYTSTNFGLDIKNYEGIKKENIKRL